MAILLKIAGMILFWNSEIIMLHIVANIYLDIYYYL